jgi:hypothetical protein
MDYVMAWIRFPVRAKAGVSVPPPLAIFARAPASAGIPPRRSFAEELIVR